MYLSVNPTYCPHHRMCSFSTSTSQQIDANTLNTHFASMSTDPSYKTLPTKAKTINSRKHQQFTPYSVLHMLTKACPSGTGVTMAPRQHDQTYAETSNCEEVMRKIANLKRILQRIEHKIDRVLAEVSKDQTNRDKVSNHINHLQKPE
ncbi:hypothetical protein HELRODRAFT_165983 [Helobdella robusta]|uniref:Uncharacterized protein n=1 Tax=Helobdella robusta TaxID=6412 RepID=T1EXJ3_HELRO|nr:hypothetical protein HELRODRAFT_165983 [Helobdella robusta]ESN90325.1 hypothetical protein HELRODRAFT_165983 [Helobdella robusta]